MSFFSKSKVNMVFNFYKVKQFLKNQKPEVMNFTALKKACYKKMSAFFKKFLVTKIVIITEKVRKIFKTVFKRYEFNERVKKDIFFIFIDCELLAFCFCYRMSISSFALILIENLLPNKKYK
jgi:hypothetical protein